MSDDRATVLLIEDTRTLRPRLGGVMQLLATLLSSR